MESKINLGFGRACNLGASYSDSEFILFLNPDARVYSETLKDVLAFMGESGNTHIGICGVQLEDEDGNIARSSSRSPSAMGFLCNSTGLDKIFPSWGNTMKDWDHLSTKTVDQVIGAFFLVRRSLFDSLKGFDERFFVYFEEVDFSFRAKNLGWASVYFSGAKAFHLGGGVSQQVKAERLFYSRRSGIQYIWKHFSILKIILVCFGTLIIEPFARIMQSLARRSIVSIKETLVGYALLYRWLFTRLTRLFK